MVVVVVAPPPPSSSDELLLLIVVSIVIHAPIDVTIITFQSIACLLAISS